MAATLSARAEKLVTVAATAESGYVQRAAKAPANQPLSFVLTKGQILPGSNGDAELQKTPFENVAGILSQDLKKRFASADGLKSADQVIVVHWGLTREHSRTADLMRYEPDVLRERLEAIDDARAAEAADPSQATRVQGASAAAEADYKAEVQKMATLYRPDSLLAASNADLLGFGPAIAKGDDTAEILRSMLDEERYVVILIAYDGAELRAGKKVQLWTTRASIRSSGVNLKLALERMSDVAGRFHGTQQREVVMADAKDRRRS